MIGHRRRTGEVSGETSTGMDLRPMRAGHTISATGLCKPSRATDQSWTTASRPLDRPHSPRVKIASGSPITRHGSQPSGRDVSEVPSLTCFVSGQSQHGAAPTTIKETPCAPLPSPFPPKISSAESGPSTPSSSRRNADRDLDVPWRDTPACSVTSSGGCPSLRMK